MPSIRDGTPWPLHFHFVRIGDTERPGEVELVNVGFEIGERFDRERGGSGKQEIDSAPEPIDPATVQRIADDFVTYLEHARTALILDREGAEGAINRFRGPNRKPARLNNDFYRLIAGEYEMFRRAGIPPGKALAEKYTTDKSNVSKWVKEARRLGLIAEKGEHDA